MKRFAILIVTLAVLLSGAGTRAQTIAGIKTVPTVTATLSAQDAGTCATANACASISLGGYKTTQVQLFGTCGTCTVQFEGTVDGVNYVSVGATPAAGGSLVTSSTSAGVWNVTFSGFKLRARMSALSSGSFTVTLRATL